MSTSAADLLATMPLTTHLGMTGLRVDPSEVVISMDWKPELCTTGGMLHGGAVMALADSGGGLCAFLNLPDGAAGTSTIESKTNFFGAVTAGTITATTRPLHVGRMTIVLETEVRTDDGKLRAKVTQTQAVLMPRAPSR
jgi:uncharacterized protein (TIGR00369 family)